MTEPTQTRRPRKMAREPGDESGAAPVIETSEKPARPKRSTSHVIPKIGLVIDMLRRAEGATLAQLIEATDWQPHTTRAMLTSLRKRGHAIAKDKLDGVTRYALPPVPTE